MRWTQPVCDACWEAEHGDRRPFRIHPAHAEKCCLCGTMTRSGIFIRRDPATVRFPKEASS